MSKKKSAKIIVTGAAGFIGSHLCEQLLKLGHCVTGIDSFEEPNFVKLKNIANIVEHPHFKLIERDILNLELNHLDSDTDVIFHLAATAGVRTSWGSNFGTYVKNNVLATQHLLELAKGISLKKFILASTSSVYGNASGSTAEEHSTRPLSPYGVTKLAAEQISNIYNREFGLPLTVLRFFTVYGPRQRPDMAFHRFIKAMLTGSNIEIYGDGGQKRDFTYILDVVDACIKAMGVPEHGNVFNIGGESRASILEIIGLLERLTGINAKVSYLPTQPGEPKETWADITKAKQYLSYSPKITLVDGLRAEIQYVRELYGV